VEMTVESSCSMNSATARMRGVIRKEVMAKPELAAEGGAARQVIRG
jgi:hypothetical protein